MTVKELKEILENIPEEFLVKIHTSSQQFSDDTIGRDFDIEDMGVFNGENIFTIEV